jgi:hypothetical protein
MLEDEGVMLVINGYDGRKDEDNDGIVVRINKIIVGIIIIIIAIKDTEGESKGEEVKGNQG